MLIQLLVDNPSSWILPYARELQTRLNAMDHDTALVHYHDQVSEGDILCLLSCEKIFKRLSLNKHNLVVHESALPRGRGWSPVTWQVLEGKNRIPVTLFEADEKVDAGPIYLQDFIELGGTELLPEIKHQQGEITIKLIIDFVNQYPEITGTPQQGQPTFYSRRDPSNSELDPNKSIAKQFDLLRVVDNERYPAFFYYKNRKYIVKVYKDESHN